MIVKVKGGWRIKSEDGSKWLSKTYKTKKEAVERLRQIEGHKKK